MQIQESSISSHEYGNNPSSRAWNEAKQIILSGSNTRPLLQATIVPFYLKHQTFEGHFAASTF